MTNKNVPTLENKPFKPAYVVEGITLSSQDSSKVDKSSIGVKAVTDQQGKLWFAKIVRHSSYLPYYVGQLLSNKILQYYMGEHVAHNQFFTDLEGKKWLLSKAIPNFKTLTHMDEACDGKSIEGFESLAMLNTFVGNPNNEPKNLGVIVYPDKCIATQVDGDEAFQQAQRSVKFNEYNTRVFGLRSDKEMFRCGDYCYDKTLEGDDRVKYDDMLKAIDTIKSTDTSVFKGIVHDVAEELKVHYTEAQLQKAYEQEEYGIKSFEEFESIYNSYIDTMQGKMQGTVYDEVSALLKA